MPVPVPKPTRPTQARAVATRRRIVDATLACLVEHGFAGTSTARIAQEAGVSEGAVFRHFPTKPQLLATALEQVLAKFVAEFQDSLPPRGSRRTAGTIQAACLVLWGIFRQPDMRGVFEVYIAARTDGTLAKLLAPILRRHRAAILGEAHRLFPVAERARPDLDAAVDLIVNAMQGAALALFEGDRSAEDDQLTAMMRFAARELERLPRS